MASPGLRNSRPSGATLVEVIISFGLLGLLMSALLGIYMMGSSAWQKVDVRTELFGRMHLASIRIATASGRVRPPAIDIAPDGAAIAICSALTEDGTFDLDTETGLATWTSWELFWFDEDKGEILQRTLPRDVPGTNLVPLAREEADWYDLYLTDGTVLARDISHFELVWRTDNRLLLDCHIEGMRQRYGRQDEEKAILHTTIKVDTP